MNCHGLVDEKYGGVNTVLRTKVFGCKALADAPPAKL